MSWQETDNYWVCSDSVIILPQTSPQGVRSSQLKSCLKQRWQQFFVVASTFAHAAASKASSNVPWDADSAWLRHTPKVFLPVPSEIINILPNVFFFFFKFGTGKGLRYYYVMPLQYGLIDPMNGLQKDYILIESDIISKVLDRATS